MYPVLNRGVVPEKINMEEESWDLGALKKKKTQVFALYVLSQERAPFKGTFGLADGAQENHATAQLVPALIRTVRRVKRTLRHKSVSKSLETSDSGGGLVNIKSPLLFS